MNKSEVIEFLDKSGVKSEYPFSDKQKMKLKILAATYQYEVITIRKRPITRCIASLQSTSYTVFKQKFGEDFL